jgi:hypothetical protein
MARSIKRVTIPDSESPIRCFFIRSPLQLLHSFQHEVFGFSFGRMATLATVAPTPTINDGANFSEVVERASITDVSFNLILA